MRIIYIVSGQIAFQVVCPVSSHYYKSAKNKKIDVVKMSEIIYKKKTTLKSTLDNVLNFETNLVDSLTKLGKFDKKLIFQIRLAFHEAIINVIVHTYKKNPEKDIDVELIVEEEQITIVIRDYGQPIDISQIKSRDLDDLRENGLGVHFYKTLMDIVEYSKPTNNSGNIIKMIKNI
jgi:serine/threonine-protein kinase RsbW